ncbi:MAG TPA: chorismate synthase [Bacteroidales bacterium]|nr:chorismate synthase [Bacteroidales bacterium]
MNSFGRIFRINIYGESHGYEIGVIIDGCPAGISLHESDFITDISRRKSGTEGTTARFENDTASIKSGVYKGFTTGAPILISFTNEDIKTEDYNFDGFFRPGHADFTAYKKYNGYNDPSGAGHFSGRLTLALVAAGCVAKKVISDVHISANLISVGGESDILASVNKIRNEEDSAGGIIECRMNNLPVGLGEPFFDSVESLISHAIFSIPGAKAIEFGEGIKSSSMKGSEFNDVYTDIYGKTHTNNCGGINGGITNGNELYFRVFFKPASSIGKSQKSFNFNSHKIEEFKIEGRHDSCYVLRTPVIVEAIAAVVMADLKLIAGL